MKALPALLTLATALPFAAMADEYAPVVARSEIVQAFPVSRQVCRNEQVSVPVERTGAGVVVGGVAGGLLGHTVGEGSGKTAATAIGAIAGAIVGDRVANRDADGYYETRNVQRCSNVTEMENRVVGYNVTYEFAGKQYITRMARDPGSQVQLRISVVGGDDAAPVAYNEGNYPGRPPRRGRY